MTDSPTLLLDAQGQPLTVWRGELMGELFDRFERKKTHAGLFFFAEDKQQAVSYAGCGTEPRSFHLKASKVLDLTNIEAPYHGEIQKFLTAYAAEYDEWIDRRSGEPVEPDDLITTGYLYDYEGTGIGHRWNNLFHFAEDLGYDAVRITDATDGVVAPVWVVFQPEQIEFCQPILEEEILPIP